MSWVEILPDRQKKQGIDCPVRILVRREGVRTMDPTTHELAAALVLEHEAGLRRYLRFLRCPEADADDVLQDAFVALLRTPDPPTEYARRAAWLRRAAKHRWIDQLRRGRLLPRATTDVDALDAEYGRIAADDDAEAWLDALRGCVDALEAKARLVVERIHRDGRPLAAIAAELVLSTSGVKFLHTRAKQALRRCITAKGRS